MHEKVPFAFRAPPHRDHVVANARLRGVYQECLAIEFELSGIPSRSKAELKLEYTGRSLKQTYQPDFIVFDKIIVELKALSELHKRHRAQVHNYLKATGLRSASW